MNKLKQEKQEKQEADSTLDHALSMARQGYLILPVRKNSKEPVIKGWQSQATNDPTQIKKWFKDFPECNYGIATGKGFIVLDIDVKNGKDGFKALKSVYSDKLDTFSVLTPSGGCHYYFSISQYCPGKIGVLDGIDIKSEGGLVVGPGSVIDGKPYAVIDDTKPMQPLYEGLLRTLLSVQDGSQVSVDGRTSAAKCTSKSYSLSQEALDEGAWESLDRHLSKIDPGLDHDEWVRAVFATFNTWGYSEDVRRLLEMWSRQSRKWDEGAFRRTVDSYNPDHAHKVGLPTLRQIAISFPAKRCTPISVDQISEEEIRRLVDKHLNYSIEIISAHGNSPTEEHTKVLRILSEAMVRGMFCETGRFRKAFPLATGMGKTSCAVALCRLVSDERLNKSLAIYVETVQQGAEIVQMLEHQGIGADSVGLLHSKSEYKDAPSVAQDEASKYRFLVACHARAKTSSKYGRTNSLLMYGSQKRDLVIWDESLISTNSEHEDRQTVLDSIAIAQSRYESKVTSGRHSIKYQHVYEEFYGFLGHARSALLEKVDGIIELPALNDDSSSYDQVISSLLGDGTRKGRDDFQFREPLKKLVEFSKRGQLRLVTVRGCPALVQFEQSLDPAFDKVIILDASAPIRDLLDYDESLEIENMEVAKDYSDVIFRIADISSSKSSFESDSSHLANFLAEFRLLLDTEIPNAEDVLLYCHKEHEHEIREKVARFTSDRIGRIHVLHWGQHRATNLYADCKWTFCLGMLHLPPQAIASMIIGQTGSLRYALEDAEVSRVVRSEQAEAIYQAVSRGNSRRMIDGKAGSQTIYMFMLKMHSDPVMALLWEIMKGVRQEVYNTQNLRRKLHANASSYRELGEEIAEFLRKSPRDVVRIATRKVTKGLGLVKKGSNGSRFRSAVQHALTLLVGWHKDGSSFVRKV